MLKEQISHQELIAKQNIVTGLKGFIEIKLKDEKKATKEKLPVIERHLFTHQRPDLDALVSTWLIIR